MMKQSFIDKHFDAILGTILFGSLAFVFIAVPVSNLVAAGVKQKALNKECGTNYSRLDVLLSGDNLTELCRIKNQQFTINK